MNTVGWPKFGLNRLSVANAFLRRVVEHIEHVQEQLDAADAAEGDRPRHAQIEQRLRRQPARAARLEQDALVGCSAAAATCAVAAHGLPLKCCRLAATTKPVRGTSTLPIDPEHVRSIVWQPAARVGEIVGIAPEREVARRAAGRMVLTCAPAAVVPLEACSPEALDNV